MPDAINAKILIVDDDQIKIDSILEVWNGVNGPSWSEVAVAKSIGEARHKVEETSFDLMVLDLRIPRRDGALAHESEAKRFFEDLYEDHDLKPPREIIILSAFGEVLEGEQSLYAGEGWNMLHFGIDLQDWRDKLHARFIYLSRCVAAEGASGRSDFEVDYCILTALRSPELQQVLKFPYAWTSTGLLDATEFYKGEVQVGKHKNSIVCGNAFGMGMVHSSLLCFKAWHYFRPRVIIMVGIAAGVRKATNLGDILIGEEVWDYGAGKIDSDNSGDRVFHPDPRHVSAEHALSEALWNFGQVKEVVDGIESRWVARLPDTRLQVRKGPIASGAAVVAHTSVLNDVIARNRKLVGLEMEAFGVYSACEYLPRPRPRYICVKSVCDFADGEKCDNFQAYASYTSAEFVRLAIEGGVFENI